MPGPAVYDRIPHNAYEARALLGDERRVRLDTRTDLYRYGRDEVRMRYGTRVRSDLVIWYQRGAIRVMFPPWESRSTFMTPSLRRIACALPDEWALDVGSRTADGRRRFARLVYRGAWQTSLTSVTFEPNGSIHWSVRRDMADDLSADDLNRQVSEIQGFPMQRSRRRTARRGSPSLTPPLFGESILQRAHEAVSERVSRMQAEQYTTLLTSEQIAELVRQARIDRPHLFIGMDEARELITEERVVVPRITLDLEA